MSNRSLDHKEPYPLDSTTIKSANRKKGCIKKICHVFSLITVEPMILLYLLAMIMTALSAQNLNLEKACRVNLKLNKSICDALNSRNILGYNKSYEVEVQKVVASAYIWKFALQSIFPVIILAFVGSWSDRNGRRKACILTPVLGEICTVLGLLVCTYFFYELPMEVTIFTETMSGWLTGGMSVFMVGIFTFVCSRTSVEGRTVRVGVIHMLFQLGVTIGLAASGVAISKLGFYGVYSLALALYIATLLYGTKFIKEETRPPRSTKQNVGFLRDFFNVKYLKNTFEVVYKNKDDTSRKRIIMLLIIAMLTVGPMHGEMGVVYLYTRYKFLWNEVDFGIFFSVASVVHLAAATGSLFIFSKLLKMDDSLIGIIAGISKIAGNIMYAFAPTGTVFYMGLCADILSSILFITMRSLITKQVAADELGKMNSVFGISEAIVPLFYGPVYSATYKATITLFPGTFYLISCVMTLPVIGIYVWLYMNRTKKVLENPENLEKMQKLLVQ